MDEQEYRLKWPNAPLSKFLNRQYIDQQSSSGQQRSSSQSSSLLRHFSQPDYVVVPHVFVENDGDEEGGNSQKKLRRDPAGRSPTGGRAVQHFSSGPVVPPEQRWDGEPYDLVVFSDVQVRQLLAVGFPATFALHAGSDDMEAALWGEASVLVTEFERAAFHEHKDKTLRVLRLMPLAQAVPASAFRGSWAKGPAWLGSLRWEGVQLLHDHWLQWRKLTASASRPWGAALIPRLHVSLPTDDFFLSQEAVAAISAAGATSGDGRTTAQMLVTERRRNGLLPDFNLRLKRERREGAYKTVFGYLPFDMRKSSKWERQETLWSMIVVGRRAIVQKDVEELLDGLPHPSTVQMVAPSLPTSSAGRGGSRDVTNDAATLYCAAETMLSRELDDARRLLQFRP